MVATITTTKSDKTRPRSVRASVSYRPKNKISAIGTAEFNKYIESFQYVDVANGESDSVSVKLGNISMKWAAKWLPKKGDTLFANIIFENWRAAGQRDTMHCGRFCCDDRNFSFPENETAVINGVSCPENHSFRSTPRSKVWEKVTIYEIANTMIKQYGMELRYFGSSIKIQKTEQSDTDDCSFLNGLCNSYGLYMKIYNGRVVIYDIHQFESKPAVRDIDYSEVLDGGEYNSTLTGTYSGARIKYSVTQGKETKEESLLIGTTDRLLIVTEKADNWLDAYYKVWARIRAENRKAETLKLTLAVAGRPLWAATNINFKNAGWMSGKWFIDKVTHSVSATDGCTMQLELHRVL